MAIDTSLSTTHYEPLTNEVAIERYLDEPITLHSGSPLFGSVIFLRRIFIDALKEGVEKRIGKLVAPRIFGGGAAELVGGPAGTDLDICISRKTFSKLGDDDVGPLIKEVVLCFLMTLAPGSSTSYSQDNITAAYSVVVHARGDSVLVKVGNEIDIAVKNLIGTNLLSPSGVDGFMYDTVRRRFSCVAGSIWCNKRYFWHFHKLLLDRVYVAASPHKTQSLFCRLVHMRAHAYTLRKTDILIAKKKLQDATDWEVAKEIGLSLRSHFRSRKESLIDLMTALCLVQDTQSLVRKYAKGWLESVPKLGAGVEIFLAKIVIEEPDLAKYVLDYLHGFFLLEYAYSKKETVGAFDFTISGKEFERPMFSLKIGKKDRFVPVRNEERAPSPIVVISDFLIARSRLAERQVDPKPFEGALCAFEFDTFIKDDEEILLNHIATLWDLPTIQLLLKKWTVPLPPLQQLHATLLEQAEGSAFGPVLALSQASFQKELISKEFAQKIARVLLKKFFPVQNLSPSSELVARISTWAILLDLLSPDEEPEIQWLALQAYTILCRSHAQASLTLAFKCRKEAEARLITSEAFKSLIRAGLASNESHLQEEALKTLHEVYSRNRFWMKEIIDEPTIAALFVQNLSKFVPFKFAKADKETQSIIVVAYIALTPSTCLPTPENKKKELIQHGFQLLLSQETLSKQENDVRFLQGVKLLQSLIQLAPTIDCKRPLLYKMEKLAGKFADTSSWKWLQIYGEIYLLGEPGAQVLLDAISRECPTATKEALLSLADKDQALPRLNTLRPKVVLEEPSTDLHSIVTSLNKLSLREEESTETIIDPKVELTLVDQLKLLVHSNQIADAAAIYFRLPSDTPELPSLAILLIDCCLKAGSLHNLLLVNILTRQLAVGGIFLKEVIFSACKTLIATWPKEASIDPLQPLICAIKHLDELRKLSILDKVSLAQELLQAPHQDLKTLGAALKVALTSKNAMQEATFEYLQIVLGLLHRKTVARVSVVKEFHAIYPVLKRHLQSKEAKMLAAECIATIYNSQNTKILQLGITQCVQDIMNDSNAVILFLKVLLDKPKKLFHDTDFLKKIDLLIQIACKKYLTQESEFFDDCASTLLALLLRIVNTPGEDTSLLAYQFTKKNFLFVCDHFDKIAGKAPSNQTLLQSLLTALTLLDSIHNDWTSFYHYYKISKRYALEYHEVYATQMHTLATSQLSKLPIGKDPSQQENLFKLLIILFPFYREVAPQQLALCLTKLEKCVLTEKTLPLLLQILHLSHDTTGCPPKYLRQIFIRNIRVACTLPLGDQYLEIVLLLEKLNTMRSPTESDETSTIVQLYASLARHLIFATLSHTSVERSESILDRYLQTVILPFRRQIETQNKKTSLEQLALIQAHIKSLGLLPLFIPHWVRLYLRVENELLQKQRLTLSKLSFDEQLLQLKRHQHLLPQELKACPEDLLRDISTFGLGIVSGLEGKKIQELQHKANSSRILAWSLRTIKLYFEGRVHIANMPHNTRSMKVAALKATHSEFEQIFSTIEKAFQSVLIASESLGATLTSCKAIPGAFRGKI